MLVFITARSVGNRFNEGIYDTKIHIKKMPFLEQEPPEETRAQNMRAYQLMSKEVSSPTTQTWPNRLNQNFRCPYTLPYCHGIRETSFCMSVRVSWMAVTDVHKIKGTP